MEIEIVEVDSFTVKGYSINSPLSDIPKLWDHLNATIEEQGVSAEESFGLCLAMQGGTIHYLAGIQADLAEALPNTEESTVLAGKFIVGKVEGGVEAIPGAFNTLMAMEGIRIRNSLSFERYIQTEGMVGCEIEVWMPIE